MGVFRAALATALLWRAFRRREPPPGLSEAESKKIQYVLEHGSGPRTDELRRQHPEIALKVSRRGNVNNDEATQGAGAVSFILIIIVLGVVLYFMTTVDDLLRFTAPQPRVPGRPDRVARHPDRDSTGNGWMTTVDDVARGRGARPERMSAARCRAGVSDNAVARVAAGLRRRGRSTVRDEIVPSPRAARRRPRPTATVRRPACADTFVQREPALGEPVVRTGRVRLAAVGISDGGAR